MPVKTKILVAPLNWGLGHATRCIPIIKALKVSGFEPVIASDGDALELLKKEFPHLNYSELPSYKIRYSTNRFYFRTNLILRSFGILKAIKKEYQQTKSLVSELGIGGIISDNRLGVRHENIRSVIITHQLKVLSGRTTGLSSALHNQFIRKFDQCWVPDRESAQNLSGELSHGTVPGIPIKYTGPLSRFNKKETGRRFDLSVIISGPEPQRNLFEKLLCKELQNFKGEVILVQGKMNEHQLRIREGNITKVNFMTSGELEDLINSSELIISRSGYTTVMDLAKLGKKAFFVPTPGQYEQEYLAKRLESLNIIPFCSQSEFDLAQLDRVKDYSGFSNEEFNPDFESLFSFFQGK